MPNAGELIARNPLAAGQAMPQLPAPPGAAPGAANVHGAMQRISALNLGPDGVEQQLQFLGYLAPAIGALAKKPHVTRKDVAKAAADAVGAGKVTAQRAVDFVTGLPEDPDELRAVLHRLYLNSLMAGVALHSARGRMALAAARSIQ